ncbi:MAG: glycosyltransferase family 4 protein [Desulfobacterales bacterium]|mgnify:CR=1 FL=1|jgi:mannosylglucosylglycerate synthase|nr:glycosyltransferase family 4 protein [Desulfobacteraceae bacterium]MBT4363963.1 glycosyltransferase family 4 protein [Desulfobacteraceae bacterium]MBT7085162.1 glycosyltransferase family 4 protein [Desulfobacterales bacterium]MBT7696398.1 glycosyltransferase family 4 protein [Desulfobacterales bacterium]
MIKYKSGSTEKSVGFISTRLAGTDGVSLETEKWADVFREEGFTCYYFAGELDTPPEYSYLLDIAHFKHPEIKDIYENCFSVDIRGRYVTKKINDIKEKIKDHLYEFIEKFKIDIIVPENVLTIPLNIPLGMAITEIISEIGVPTIAHHHDFFWERQNFLRNAIWEYLNMSFPPHLPNIHHVIINSSADNQLSLRTGVSATIIPNVMDFHNPPPPLDEYASDVRQALGIEDDELFILQPTRVVKRKGIEHAIELVSRMDEKAKLVISHASGDEGYDYENRIRDYSNLLNVNTLFVSEIINEERGLTEDGRKIYTLDDIYPHADLVTYPSNFEGFGNAFLEAIYFRKPIVVNNYSIYSMDIKPKGFSVVEIDGYVTEEAVQLTKKVLSNTEYREKMIEHNYKIATRYFSYAVLREKLKILIDDCIR